MLKVIPLEENLVQATAAELSPVNANDFSRYAVITPSSRFHLFLRRELARIAGRTFFPPRLFSIDGFIQFLHDSHNPGIASATEIEAAHAVYECCRTVYGRNMYAGERMDSDFPAFFPRARQILAAIEEILVEGVDFERIDARGFELFAGLGDYHESYKAFISKLPVLAGAFRDKTAERKFSTRGTRYRAVADLCVTGGLNPPAGIDRWIFSGFHALNRSETKILSWFMHRFPALFLVQTDEAAWSDPGSPFHLQWSAVRSLELPAPVSVSAAPIWKRLSASIRIHPVTGREEAMIRTYEILERSLQERPESDATRIGVVLPDASALIPFVQNVVSRIQDERDPTAFNITLAFPFDRTPLFQLLDSILRINENATEDQIRSEDYLALLRHPYVKLSGGANLRPVIHSVETCLEKNNILMFEPDALFEWMKTESDLPAEKVPENKLRESLESIASLNDRFLLPFKPDAHGAILRLLETLRFLEQSTEGKYYLFFAEHLAGARSVLEEALCFVREHPEAFTSKRFAPLASFLRHLLSSCRIFFEGSPLKGIQVMGMLEFRGLSFDEIIVADTIEGVMPPSRKYDPLLPYDIRRLLKIGNHMDWDRLFALHFFSLAASCRRIHFLVPERTPAGEMSERSRFLERLIYEIEKRGAAPIAEPPHYLKYAPPAPVPVEIFKNRAVRERLERMTLSPSSLETYLHCPLRFYYQHILKLEEREEIRGEADAGEFGTIVHDTLQELYAPLIGEKIDTVDSDLFPDEAIEKAVARSYKANRFDPLRGLERIRFWILLRKLQYFLKTDLERIVSNRIILRVLETDIDASLPVPGQDQAASLKGRIDRVEEQDGLLRIIDYKTGNRFSAALGGRNIPSLSGLNELAVQEYLERLHAFAYACRSFQILVYLVMAEKKWNVPISRLDGAYVFLKETDKKFAPIFSSRFGKPLPPEEKSALFDAFKADLNELLADLYVRENFLPNPSDAKYCSHCPFSSLCGSR